MNAFRIEVVGLGSELRRLKAILDKKKRTEAFKKVLRKVGNYYLRQFRKGFRKHNRTGNLTASLKSKLKYYASKDTFVILIGVASWWTAYDRYGRKHISHKYAHLMLRGHKAFTQTLTLKPGRNLLRLKNRSAHPIVIRRRVGRASGDDVISRETRDSSKAISIARKEIEKCLLPQ